MAITKNLSVAGIRNGYLITPSNAKKKASEQVRVAASIEMANLGFIVPADDLRDFSDKSLESTLGAMRSVMGADREMTPVYPGFPKQVQELSTMTLLMEQILHYWSGGTLVPDYPDVIREGLPVKDALRNARRLEVLDVKSGLIKVVTEVASRKISLSEDEKSLMAEALSKVTIDVSDAVAIASKVENAENKQSFIEAFLSSFDGDKVRLISDFAPTARNADDLLRIVLLLGSEPSRVDKDNAYNKAVFALNNTSAYGVNVLTMPTSVRKSVVKALNSLVANGEFFADSFVSKKQLWRKVMRSMHFFSYINKYEKAEKVAHVIHDNMDYETLNAVIESLLDKGDTDALLEVLSSHAPGLILRRAKEIVLKGNKGSAGKVAEAIKTHASKMKLTTLISSYSGLASAYNDSAKVIRMAGQKNMLVETQNISKRDSKTLAIAVLSALEVKLRDLPAPEADVASVSDAPVPLVRRDAASTDRIMDRGERMGIVGSGDTLRLFTHWTNTSSRPGYMDIGALVTDKDFNELANASWNTWASARDWATYSGDTLVHPGKSAPEYIDVNVKKLKKSLPQARYVVMSVISYSSIPFASVDVLSGVMLRSKAKKGEVFDPRSVNSAFRVITEGLDSIPFVYDLKTGEMTWIDSSSGSSSSHQSLLSIASMVARVAKDEMVRERLTMGQLATAWANAHGRATTQDPVDRNQIVALLNS